MIQHVNNFVHDSLEKVIGKNDIVIDATVGNGHDTLFLSMLAKKVIGFDVQKSAIDETTRLLTKHQRTNVSLHLDGHENLDLYTTSLVKAVTFNLGYLPGSDKTVTTVFTTTVEAIKKALSILDIGGIVSIIVYTGHNGGMDESTHIFEHLKTIDMKHYQVLKYQFLNRKNAPYVLLIEKTK
jgi:hypothetical protein